MSNKLPKPVNYSVDPVTSECDELTSHDNVVVAVPGSKTDENLNDINHQQNQNEQNTRFDSINNNDPTIKTGGSAKKQTKKTVTIIFKNKNYRIVCNKNCTNRNIILNFLGKNSKNNMKMKKCEITITVKKKIINYVVKKNGDILKKS